MTNKTDFIPSFFVKLKNILNYNLHNKIPNYRRRAYAMGLFFCIVITIILIRFAWITFFPTPLRSKLLQRGNRQFDTVLTLAKPRAIITDRYGRALAVSVSRPSLFLLTKKMPRDLESLKKVSAQIKVPVEKLLHYSREKRNFIWLKRQMSLTEFNSLGSLKKWQYFIGTIDEPKRYYPEKDIASQLIGFVGADGNGLEGIEKIFNDRLNSKPTKIEVMRDARGRLVMATPNDASKPEPKIPNLRLSIDLQVQEFTQKALKTGVLKAMAKGGSAVVMDVQTGEILAIASYPTYDLNHPPEDSPQARRFRPIMDAIELGSVVKPMLIAKALDLGVINKGTKIFAEFGKLAVPGGYIHDTHPHGWLNPEEILMVSSNIAMYKIAQKIGRERFYDLLIKIGFGRQPGTGLPGEWGGRIRTPESWREMNFANMAFGQGFAISPLQLAHALAIISGGGKDHGVNILAQDKNQKEHQVGPYMQFIKPETSRQIVKMMESVVESNGGTGKAARIPGLKVAGKTGTAQIWSQQDKAYTGRTAVFEGVIPSDNPKLAIVVVIDEAQVRPAFGGPLAGPVFTEIARKTVDYFNSQGVYSVTPVVNSYLYPQKNRISVSTVDH